MSTRVGADGLRYITRDECRRMITPKHALRLVEQALRWEASGEVEYPNPKNVKLRAAGGALTYHSKTVSLPALGVLGTRVVSYRVDPDGRRPGADRSTRLIVLIDTATGETLAIVDEHYNYALRTAASVGVAAQYLAGANPSLGVIGAGTVARATIAVMIEALPLEAIRIFSRTPERTREVIDSFAEITDVPFTVCDDVDEVAANCTVLVTATTTSVPFIGKSHLRPGMIVCALGSNELEREVYEACDRLLVDDPDQMLRAADIVALAADGLDMKQRIGGDLAGLVTGSVPRRRSPDEVIVIRTEGLASQDIALAHFAWESSTHGRQ